MVTKDTILRVTQMTCQLAAVLFGLMTTLGAAWASTVIEYKCPLHANMSIEITPSEDPDDTRDVLTVNMPASVFGKNSVCQYTTFLPAVTSIYAIIWFWFYILLNNWNRQERKQQKRSTEKSRLLDAPPPPPPPPSLMSSASSASTVKGVTYSKTR